jgi:hypothetical protein
MMEVTGSSETLVDFNGLHEIVSQKIELFIHTAVRASDAITDVIIFTHV